MKKSSLSSGLGLLELLLALAVTAVILIISVNYYINVRNEQKIDEFINQLVAISRGVVDYVNAHSSQATADNNPLTFLTSSMDPKRLVTNHLVTPQDVINVWVPNTNYQSILITFSNCISIAVEAPGLPRINGDKTVFCSQFLRPRLTAALPDSVILCGSGGDINVRFCANTAQSPNG